MAKREIEIDNTYTIPELPIRCFTERQLELTEGSQEDEDVEDQEMERTLRRCACATFFTLIVHCCV